MHGCFCKSRLLQTGIRAALQSFLSCYSGRFRADPYKNYMAVAVNWGPFCGCPYNKGPTILWSVLGALIFGNYHITAHDNENIHMSYGQYFWYISQTGHGSHALLVKNAMSMAIILTGAHVLMCRYVCVYKYIEINR